MESAVAAKALTGLRERELGLPESGSINEARRLLKQLTSAAQESLRDAVELADILPSAGDASASAGRRSTAVAQAGRYRRYLTLHGRDGPLQVYAGMGFVCAYESADSPSRDRYGLWSSPWAATKLGRYAHATCRSHSWAEFRHEFEGEFVEAHFANGALEWRAGRASRALRHWRAALEWRPNWPLALEWAGQAELALEDYPAALEHFERAAGARSAPAALLGRAEALLGLGQYEAAVLAVGRLLENGEFVGDANLTMASAFIEMGRLAAAWDSLAEAYEWLGASPRVRFLQGTVAYRQGRLLDARATLMALVNEAPGQCAALAQLAQIAVDVGEADQSISQTEQASACIDHELVLAQPPQAGQPTDDGVAALESRLVGRRQARAYRIKVWTSYLRAEYLVAAGRHEEAKDVLGRLTNDREYGVKAKALLTRLR